MRIYWGSTLKNPREAEFWEPAIMAVSRANGNFPCRWSIFTLLKKHNPNQKKYALGVAEVTAVQEAAVAASPIDIFYLNATQIKQTFSTLTKPQQNRVSTFCVDTVGIAAPTQSEILYDLWNRMGLATDNKTLTQLEAELDQDMKVKAQSLIVPVIPGLLLPSTVSRRFILKAAGLVGLYSILRPRLAQGVTVFTDTFTVGVDTNLDGTYPNWTPTDEPTTGYPLFARASDGRVHTGYGGSAYPSAGGIPTGNQKITVDCYGEAVGPSYPGLLTRVDLGTFNRYLAYFDVVNNLVEIYRYDAGAYPLLVSGSRGVGYPASCSFEATGTAPVSLTAIGGFTAAVTTTDGSGSLLTSGPPGIRLRDPGDYLGWIDNVVVDDLTTPAVTVRRRSVVVQ